MQWPCLSAIILFSAVRLFAAVCATYSLRLAGFDVSDDNDDSLFKSRVVQGAEFGCPNEASFCESMFRILSLCIRLNQYKTVPRSLVFVACPIPLVDWGAKNAQVKEKNEFAQELGPTKTERWNIKLLNSLKT